MAAEFEFNPMQVNWSGDFEQQVKRVMEYVRLTRAEVDDLSNLFGDLQKTLQEVWRGCEVMPFGSVVTGLGIRSSDVDCYVHVPECYEYDQVRFVMTARNSLRKRRWIFQDAFAITTAKVPIVKFYHIPTERQCDVSFKSPSGVRNSKLIAYLLHLDSRALPLAILIKFWSKVHKLTGTNLLPNYSLTMMTIFYLQHKNILPPVSLLQHITNGPFIVDNWNTQFCENYCHKTDNTENLYELLGGFFKFYSTFKFDEFIISPFVGNSISRKLFENLNDVPNDFGMYKKLVSEGFPPIKIDKPICIQDVFEHARNCTVAVFPRLAMRLTLHIQLAAKIYTEGDSQHFLRQILVQKPNIPKPEKVPRPNVSANTEQAPVVAPNITDNSEANAPNTANGRQGRRKNLKRRGESLTSLFIRGRKKGKR